MIKIEIENIITSAKISEIFNIKLLSGKIKDCNYNPLEFDGLSIKYDNENIAVLILGTGKVFCTGAKDINDAFNKIKKVINQIKKIGFDIKKDYEIIIENIIVSADFKKELNLTNISKGMMSQDVDYQPDVFPGLIYKMDDLHTILIIFNSGKIVCIGAKNIDSATNSINKMEEKLTSIGVL